MNKARFLKTLIVAGIVAVGMFGLAACANNGSSKGSIAATVTMGSTSASSEEAASASAESASSEAASSESASSESSAASASAASESASSASAAASESAESASASSESASSESSEASESASSASAAASATEGNNAQNGEPTTFTIYEDEITTTIQNLRAQSNLEDEDTWGKFLASNDMTPQSVREQTINSFVDQDLIKAGASQLGITIDSSEIDTYVASMRANFDTDEAWEQALKQAGFTEDEYRTNIETALTQQAINKHFQDEVKVEDSDIDDAAKTYASVYDGAKRSSHILIGVSDTSDKKAMKEAREKAEDLKSRIESGAISFEDAAKENSTDEGSGKKGGDVGWDVLNSFVTEYTDALDNLNKDEISDPVESQYGIHIIKVTDVYEAPDDVKGVKDLPEDFRSTIEEYAKTIKANQAYSDWLEGLRSSADIKINDMPENVPYNVDMSKYSAESADDTEDGDGEVVELDGDEGGEVIELEGDEDASASSASAESSDSASSASGSSASAESAGSESASASSASASSESASS